MVILFAYLLSLSIVPSRFIHIDNVIVNCDFVIHKSMWMNLEGIMLSERS